MLEKLCVVIPVGPRETSSEGARWIQLAQSRPQVHFLLCICPQHPQEIEFHRFAEPNMRVLVSPQSGRAHQLNFAFSRVPLERSQLLMVHFDCQLASLHLDLVKTLPPSRGIYHFKLKFTESREYKRLLVNEWGANLRSALLKLPFGDQGFLFDCSTYRAVGEFPEDVRYGEDHCWIWQAHLKGIPVVELPLTLATSARKYIENGWLRTTTHHIYLTLRQAYPHYRSLKRRYKLI